LQSSVDPGVSVVIPIFNGAALVDQLVHEVGEAIKETGEPYEILLIDDGSRDNSWQAIRLAASRQQFVKGYRLSRNFGQQIAVTAGISRAHRNYIIVMDGDLQNPPSAIPLILDALKKDNDVVYTTSKVRNDANDEMTSRIFWFVLSGVFKIDIIKHQLMMRGMTSKVARIYDSYPEATRTVAGIFQDLGFKSTVIEVANGRRVKSASNYGFFKRLDLMIHMVISLTTMPLNILIYLSFMVLVATTLSSIYYLANAFFHTVPSGFTTIILAVLFFGSLTMLLLGVIGLYLANIYTEVRRRPLFLVAEETDVHG
jgi:glycosyltransferase involved in cell wall biosynthesis